MARAQGAFEYVLLVGLVLALVVGIIITLRGGLGGSGSNVALTNCLAQLSSSSECYNTTGGWDSNKLVQTNAYRACGSSPATAQHGTCGALPTCYCGPKPS
ncbi:MAG TPA: hypothetical protein VGQ00_01990 [Candidatus Norongarragalinales archaeon]|jgi:hypothetical protein|nr:hypothetical protein [Candidatus Norongarragalinales archaeon]